MSVESVLVCRLSALGDVVLTLPAVDALRERFPGARLEYLSREPHGRILSNVTTLDALHLWPGPGTALPEPVAARRWSLVCDLQASARSRSLLAGVRCGRRLRARKDTMKRLALVKLRSVGGGRARPRPAVDRLFSCLEDLGLEREDRRPHLDVPPPPSDGPVVIAPGAGRATKRWPEERFAAVAARLLGDGIGVLLVGSEEERRLLERISRAAGHGARVAACADLSSLPRIVAEGPVALCNDSGMLHVAEACGVAVVALFGPTHPRLGFAPLGPSSTVVHSGISCSPCDLHGPHVCPLVHHRCMQDLDVEQVLRVVRERLPSRVAS